MIPRIRFRLERFKTQFSNDKLLPLYEKYRGDKFKPKNYLEQSSPKALKDFKWPFYIFSEYNTEIQKWIQTKKLEIGTEQLSNIMFIIGPQGSGKSWLLKYNLKTLEQQIQQQGKQSIIIHWNLENYNMINYSTFLNVFEGIIIQTLIKNESLLTNEQIYVIFKEHYAPEYLQLFVKDTMYQLINDEDFFFVSDEIKQHLIEMRQDLTHEFITLEQFQQIIEAIEPEFSNSLEASLTFCLSVLKRIENEYRKYPNSFERTGINTSDFLFDILNYLEGFHPQNKNQIAHCLLTFQNLDQAIDSYPYDEKIYNFLDHIILRTYTDTNCRTHFPIIIESNKSRFFSRDIIDMVGTNIFKYPIVEIYGFLEQDIEILSHIYTKSQLDKMKFLLGSSLQDWHSVTKYLLKQGHIPDDLYQTPYFVQQRNIFNQKINKFYLDQEINEQLDKDMIDYQLLDIFETLQFFNGKLHVKNHQTEIEFLENPIIKALIDTSILYHRFYFPMLTVNKKLYTLFIEEYVAKKKKELGRLGRLKYFYWRKRKGVDSSDCYFQTHMGEHEINMKASHYYEINVYHPKKIPDHDL